MALRGTAITYTSSLPFVIADFVNSETIAIFALPEIETLEQLNSLYIYIWKIGQHMLAQRILLVYVPLYWARVNMGSFFRKACLGFRDKNMISVPKKKFVNVIGYVY